MSDKDITEFLEKFEVPEGFDDAKFRVAGTAWLSSLLNTSPEKRKLELRAWYPEKSDEEIEDMMEGIKMVQWMRENGLSLKDIERLAADLERIRQKPQ